MYFTTILHHVRKQFSLSCNDYCVVELIHFKMNDPESKMIGWCTFSRQQFADELDLSRQTIITILQKLKEKGLIEENETSFLRTSKTWFDAITHCQETLRGVKKLYTKKGVKKLDTLSKNFTPTCKETLPPPVKKLDTTPYINKYINEINEEEEEENRKLQNQNLPSPSSSNVENLFLVESDKTAPPVATPPPSKDYIDELSLIVKSNSAAFEEIGMILRVGREKIIEIFNAFEVEQRFKGVRHLSMKDLKSHFISYARINLQNDTKNANRSNRGNAERNTSYDYTGEAF